MLIVTTSFSKSVELDSREDAQELYFKYVTLICGVQNKAWVPKSGSSIIVNIIKKSLKLFHLIVECKHQVVRDHVCLICHCILCLANIKCLLSNYWEWMELIIPPPLFFFSKQGLSTNFLLHGNQQVYILIFFSSLFGIVLYLGWNCHFLLGIWKDDRSGT